MIYLLYLLYLLFWGCPAQPFAVLPMCVCFITQVLGGRGAKRGELCGQRSSLSFVYSSISGGAAGGARSANSEYLSIPGW